MILAGGVPVEIPARLENNFTIDPDDIRKAITPRTKAIFIGYPSNPTGAVAPREVMLEIGKIAEQHNLIVVSDEIYDRLVYDFEHVCFPALDESLKQRTVLLGGFSKAYAMTGWRIGYACAPTGYSSRHVTGSSIHDHVRADHCAGCRDRSLEIRRTACAGNGDRI